VGSAGFGFQGGEAGGVTEVRGNRHRAGVAAADQLGVDHRVPGPDVGQQAPVTITRLDIQLEPDGSPAGERGIHAGCADASGSARAPRATVALVVRDLRRVDADIADALDAITNPHVDGVAVVDVYHDAGDGADGLRRRRARSDDRQQYRDETESDTPGRSRHRSHAVTSSRRRQCPESWTATGTVPTSREPRRISAPPTAIRNGRRGARCARTSRSSAAAARRSASRVSTSSPVT
jgi:hypothetical protein